MVVKTLRVDYHRYMLNARTVNEILSPKWMEDTWDNFIETLKSNVNV